MAPTDPRNNIWSLSPEEHSPRNSQDTAQNPQTPRALEEDPSLRMTQLPPHQGEKGIFLFFYLYISCVTSWWKALAQIYFCAPKQKRTLVRTACACTRTATRENCYCRGGLAIGSTGIFPGGPINSGPMDSCFIYLFAAPTRFSVDAVKIGNKKNRASASVWGGQQQGQLVCSVIETNKQYDNSPGPGRETCISSAHSTQHRGDETRLIMTDRHQGHSALPYQPTPNYFIHKNRGLWQFWTAVFFFLPSWAPDGVWSPVQLHQLRRRYFGLWTILIYNKSI